MLYELYKMFYINLYDNLIVVFLFSLIIICKFIIIFFFKCVLHFNQVRTCTLCLGSKRPLSLSVPCAFTNTVVITKSPAYNCL